MQGQKCAYSSPTIRTVFAITSEILSKIEALNEKTGSELVTAVKAEIEKNSTFRKLMQGQDVFNSSRCIA